MVSHAEEISSGLGCPEDATGGESATLMGGQKGDAICSGQDTGGGSGFVNTSPFGFHRAVTPISILR